MKVNYIELRTIWTRIDCSCGAAFEGRRQRVVEFRAWVHDLLASPSTRRVHHAAGKEMRQRLGLPSHRRDRH